MYDTRIVLLPLIIIILVLYLLNIMYKEFIVSSLLVKYRDGKGVELEFLSGGWERRGWR